MQKQYGVEQVPSLSWAKYVLFFKLLCFINSGIINSRSCFVSSVEESLLKNHWPRLYWLKMIAHMQHIDNGVFAHTGTIQVTVP